MAGKDMRPFIGGRSAQNRFLCRPFLRPGSLDSGERGRKPLDGLSQGRRGNVVSIANIPFNNSSSKCTAVESVLGDPEL